jgi:hypothetical protein
MKLTYMRQLSIIFTFTNMSIYESMSHLLAFYVKNIVEFHVKRIYLWLEVHEVY